jgi:TM2 domain-containing membrane protein YozV
LDPLAGLLSYLVPGLGQVMQGRIGKGVLFFVCLYGLFFYGLYLSSWRSVWLADCRNLPDVQVPFLNKQLPGTLKDLSYRKGFVAQFFIGSAAWPAVVQYLHTEPLAAPPAASDPDQDDGWRPKPHPWFRDYMQAPPEAFVNKLQSSGDKLWDLGWVYTVIAGILNILVIFDALSGPMVRDDGHDPKAATPPAGGAA